jgi:hypothetical protein
MDTGIVLSETLALPTLKLALGHGLCAMAVLAGRLMVIVVTSERGD